MSTLSREALLERLKQLKAEKRKVEVPKEDDVEIPSHIQKAVDDYLPVYNQIKELESILKELRGIIEPFMDENELDIIEGTDGGKIERVMQERPPISARYTAYSAELVSILPASLKRDCVVQLVDRDKLEALDKLGKIKGDIKLSQYKVSSPVFNFRATTIK